MSVLAVDIGGTKTLAALVEGARVTQRVEIMTDREAGPEAWVAQIAAVAESWRGQFDRAGITVTGVVQNGQWSALNPKTLDIPTPFALGRAVQEALNVPVILRNDAQAAAWGEHIYGAGYEQDIVFLTISTGVGGGVVCNRQLLHGRGGLAGHFGQVLPLSGDQEARFEDGASGQWIAAQGKAQGHFADTHAVFAAAAAGDQAADEILQTSAKRVARLCLNLQMMFDPEVVVIGGGVGLAPTYLERLVTHVAHIKVLLRPTFVRAALGKDAGIIGVADLSKKHQPNREEAK